MGVTKDQRDLFYFGYIEDDFDLNNIENEESVENTDSNVRQDQRKKKKNFRGKHGVKGHQDSLYPGSRKRKGIKQTRRCENMRQLLDMVEKEDGFELDYEVFEPSVSAFAELFVEKEKMKVWNDFINCSEEEQNQILHGKRVMDNEIADHRANLNDSWEEIEDHRTSHPAFTAEECFKRIDKNIKLYLKRRQMPLGLLSALEAEVTSFFQEWPTSVYISKLENSFERMNLHALCQYLDLRSYSYDQDGRRHTQVENKHDYFSPPNPLLTAYLQKGSS